MADTKISALSTGTTPAVGDEFAIARSGANYKLTWTQMCSNIVASGAVGITPASGSNLNVSLAGAGDLAVNTNHLYVDTSAGNVGIGTASPESLLTLKGGSLAATDSGRSLFFACGLTTGRLASGFTGSSKVSSIHTYYDDVAVEISAGSSASYVSGITIAARTVTGTQTDAVGIWTRSVQQVVVNGLGNVGIGTTSFGTNAAKVLGIATGTAPTTGPADTVQFYSSDDAAGHTIPSFFCEGTNVIATGQADSVSSVRVKMRINGTVVTLLAI